VKHIKTSKYKLESFKRTSLNMGMKKIEYGKM